MTLAPLSILHLASFPHWRSTPVPTVPGVSNMPASAAPSVSIVSDIPSTAVTFVPGVPNLTETLVSLLDFCIALLGENEGLNYRSSIVYSFPAFCCICPTGWMRVETGRDVLSWCQMQVDML